MGATEPAAVELLTAVTRLLRTARTYSRVRSEHEGPSGVTLGVLTLLGAASARPGDLALALGVTPSAVSRAVSTLEGLGYVARASDPTDARACFLALTDAGSLELARLHHDRAVTISGLLEDWDEAQVIDLTLLLDKLNTALADAVRELRHGAHLDVPDPLASTTTTTTITAAKVPT